MAAKGTQWASVAASSSSHTPRLPLAVRRLAPESAAGQAPAHSPRRSPGTVLVARVERGCTGHRAGSQDGGHTDGPGPPAETQLRPMGKVDNHGSGKHRCAGESGARAGRFRGGGTREQVEGPSPRVLETPDTCSKANTGTRRNYSSETQHAEAVCESGTTGRRETGVPVKPQSDLIPTQCKSQTQGRETLPPGSP